MAEARQSQFALDIRAWCEKAKGNANQVVRAVSIELLSRIVQRSPVGNPELWAANAHVMSQRASYNDEVARTNSLIDAHPEFRLKYGKLKKQRTLSAKTIAKRLPLEQGRGYTGGRFRANWNVSIGAPDNTTSETIDPSGGGTIARGTVALEGIGAGVVIYLTNSLPYAVRLEYGWSKHQAPSGVVRVVATEFQAIVTDEVAKLP